MGSGWRLIAKDFAWVAFVFSPLSVRFGPSRFWESHHALPQLQPYEIALSCPLKAFKSSWDSTGTGEHEQ